MLLAFWIEKIGEYPAVVERLENWFHNRLLFACIYTPYACAADAVFQIDAIDPILPFPVLGVEKGIKVEADDVARGFFLSFSVVFLLAISALSLSKYEL